jgi:GTP cyclohydrolase II
MERHTIPSSGEEEGKHLQTVIPIAKANLPTAYGEFTLQVYFDEETEKEHSALFHGPLSGSENCPVRIHSQCFTGDVLGSLRCDCREQLQSSIEYLGLREFGLLIYLNQEGRGIGLLNKIRAYQLQDSGCDTVDANRCLGLPDDPRDYRVAATIIKMLGITSVSLLTNNPKKITGLRKYDIEVVERIPLKTEPTCYNRSYLEAKKNRMGHLF